MDSLPGTFTAGSQVAVSAYIPYPHFGQTSTEVIKMTNPNKELAKKPIQPMPLDVLDGEERPIPDVYKAIDNDLARDNLENDMPSGDLQDI